MTNKTSIKTASSEINRLSPQAILYLETGGFALAEKFSRSLGLKMWGLDIRYPASRWMSKFKVLKPMIWLFKELLYRVTRPTLRTPLTVSLCPNRKVLLVDDSISSFRSIQVALNTLRDQNISPDDIIIATLRCSRKSRPKVHYVIS